MQSSAVIQILSKKEGARWKAVVLLGQKKEENS